jgi:peroxiredoxin
MSMSEPSDLSVLHPPSPREAEQLRQRLIGSYMPAVPLSRFDGEAFYLRELSEDWIAYYIYPGASIPSGPEGAAADRAQHQAFLRQHQTLETNGVRPVGISSQNPKEQLATILDNAINHSMLCDPPLALAASLGLPTFKTDQKRYYRRVTLLAHVGIIAWCFYPVDRPQANPDQVLSWLQLNR